MNAELVGFFKAGSPAWHAARTQGVGGSEVAALLGISKWESRFSLWHRKQGLLGPKQQTPEMEAGRRLEPAICRKFADEHPEFRVMRAGTYRSRLRPFQMANPDRLAFDACPCGENPCDHPVPAVPAAILEAKFALFPDEWGEPGTDQIPPYYRVQNRWYLDTFGIRRCYTQVFIGSTGEFREYVVEHDESEAVVMRQMAAEFMDSIRDQIRPAIDEHSETYEAVREMHPDIDDEVFEVPSHIAIPYMDAVDAAKAADAVKQQAATVLLDAMGRARRAYFLGEQIAMRVPGRGGSAPFLRAESQTSSSAKAVSA